MRPFYFVSLQPQRNIMKVVSSIILTYVSTPLSCNAAVADGCAAPRSSPLDLDLDDPLNLPRNITEATDWKKYRYQDDPTNIYQRWRWDPNFCNAKFLGRRLLRKMYLEQEEFDEIMDAVCEMSVEIGMRLIALLGRNEIFWPWSHYISHVETAQNGLVDAHIQESKENYGDEYKICEVVAHYEPDTDRVLGIGLTDDYEAMWKTMDPEKSFPVYITGANSIMRELIRLPDSEYSDVSFTPEFKTLSVDLLVLIGHPRVEAENRLQEESEEMMYFSHNGILAILSSVYSAFIVLYEESSSMNGDKPTPPNYDDEPLDEFRSELLAFIDDLDFIYDDMTIDDMLYDFFYFF